MSNKPAQIKIITVPEDQANWNPSDEINGIVVVYPQIDVGIYSLSLELVYQRRGNLAGQKKTLQKLDVAANEQWEAGGEYPYKFKLTLPNANNHIMLMGSYKGNNVNYYLNLQAKVDFNTETDNIIRAESIKKLNLARSFYPEKGTTVSKELLIFPDNNPLQLLHAETISNPIKQYLRKWYFVVLPFLSIFMSVFSSSILPFVIINSAILGYFIFLYLFLQKNIGKVTASIFESNDKTFSIKYDFLKNLNAVQRINTYLEILERVVDRRGTSTSINTTNIYTSKKQEIDDWTSSIKANYDLPPPNMPFPVRQGDVSLLWNTVLEIEFQHFPMLKIKVPLHFITKTETIEQSIDEVI